ncbi:hypothetical protein B0H14DRAFT_2556935 [Mycena olivaceomarginata]|nr:hypothetical protein B0H14DRAFT_2556935 [Mycena olivaceomarginata]
MLLLPVRLSLLVRIFFLHSGFSFSCATLVNDHGSISQDEYGSIVAYKHKVLNSYTSEGASACVGFLSLTILDLTELIRKLDQSLEGQRTITEKIDDLQKDIDELKPQLSKLMTVSMRDHNIRQGTGKLPGASFEVVPFDNGTSPPANLPVLGSVDIIRDLNPIQSSEYYKGYGGAPQRGGNAQQNHLTRKEFIRRRVGCSVELQ